MGMRRDAILDKNRKIDRVFKNRDVTLLTNFCIVKAMVFPVVIYGFES